MSEELLPKRYLLRALKEAGLTHTFPNFIFRYETTVCDEHNKPLLVSKRGPKNQRLYSQLDIDGIVRVAKEGWFRKHWHWPPIT